MREAKEPFQFVAASYLIRIRPERARTLAEMGRGLRSCSPESIFYHTFQSLESHHYAAFSSDFAQWIMAACNEAALAERLAALDVRDFVSVEDLRSAIVTAVDDALRRYPASADRPAFEPFHFCEALEVTVPLDAWARTLPDLMDGIRRLSLHTLHYHFINSRLRLHLRTNDFSNWIANSLGLPQLAEKVNRIDFYTNTLDGVREEVLKTMQPWVNQ